MLTLRFYVRWVAGTRLLGRCPPSARIVSLPLRIPAPLSHKRCVVSGDLTHRGCRRVVTAWRLCGRRALLRAIPPTLCHWYRVASARLLSGRGASARIGSSQLGVAPTLC